MLLERSVAQRLAESEASGLGRWNRKLVIKKAYDEFICYLDMTCHPKPHDQESLVHPPKLAA